MHELVPKLVQLDEAIPERLRDHAARCERPQILASRRGVRGCDRAAGDQATMSKLDHVVLEQLEGSFDRICARQLLGVA